MVGFDFKELANLFIIDKKKIIKEKILEKGDSFDGLKNDTSRKMEEIVGLAHKTMQNKEDTEIYIALFIISQFYKNSEILFSLKNDIDPRKKHINSLGELKNILKENGLTDFAFMSEDGLRQFQLKQYKEELNTEKVFNFIKKKLLHYSNDMGDINLLLILQKRESYIDGIDFYELNKSINRLKLKSSASIMLYYNEENKFSVINTVYPEVSTTRIPRNRADWQTGS